jgi:flavin reductase (DIM6/NTAB) family NADH-FMN oxidoreductase RutF
MNQTSETGLDIDPDDLGQRDLYKLVCGLVVPRPIALTTTMSVTGVVNAAPFSFFNIFSERPAVVALGLNSRPDGSIKDTTRNIRETGEYVIHVVTQSIAEKANVCATEFPSDMSEIDIARFTLKPSLVVSPPTIAEAPVALECRLMSITPLSPVRNIVLGEVVRIRTAPGIVDPERFHVDISAYRPVARLFGNLYARLGELFELKRLTYSEWQDKEATKAAKETDSVQD